jgi:hypothetical protein
MTLTHLRILAVAAAISCAGAAHAAAPPTCGEPGRPPHDHEQARAALTRGEVVPLRRVLETVERQTPGDILKIELLATPNGGLIYKLKILARDGRVVKHCVDARTGALTACPER